MKSITAKRITTALFATAAGFAITLGILLARGTGVSNGVPCTMSKECASNYCGQREVAETGIKDAHWTSICLDAPSATLISTCGVLLDRCLNGDRQVACTELIDKCPSAAERCGTGETEGECRGGLVCGCSLFGDETDCAEKICIPKSFVQAEVPPPSD